MVSLYGESNSQWQLKCFLFFHCPYLLKFKGVHHVCVCILHILGPPAFEMERKLNACHHATRALRTHAPRTFHLHLISTYDVDDLYLHVRGHMHNA